MKFITTDDFSTYPGIIFLCLIGSGHNVTNVGKRILLNEIDLCLRMMKHDAILHVHCMTQAIVYKNYCL